MDLNLILFDLAASCHPLSTNKSNIVDERPYEGKCEPNTTSTIGFCIFVCNEKGFVTKSSYKGCIDRNTSDNSENPLVALEEIAAQGNEISSEPDLTPKNNKETNDLISSKQNDSASLAPTVVSEVEVISTEKSDLPSISKPALREVTLDEIDEDSFTCIPNEPFKLECNTCWCNENGLEPRFCTRIACHPKVYPS